MCASPCECVGLSNVRRESWQRVTQVSLLNTYIHARAYATSLVLLSVCTSGGVSEPPYIPKEGKISFPPLPFPPLLYPISYSILDPITRLLPKFKAEKREESLIQIGLSPLSFVFALVFIICCPQRALVHLTNSEGITEIRLQRQRTQVCWHTQADTHIHRRAFKGSCVCNRLASWEWCPSAFEGNKLNNLTLLHEFHIQDAGWISSLRKDWVVWKDFKGCFVLTFLGNVDWKPSFPTEPQHSWGWQTRRIQGMVLWM